MEGSQPEEGPMETAAIIIGMALIWAIFPIGMAYSLYKLDLETGEIKPNKNEHATEDIDEEHEKMAA